MYESYWQLSQKPFDPHSDARFFYPSEGHQAALLRLQYVVEHRGGAALLVGPGGTGKTLLVKLLKQNLSEEFTPFVHMVFPQMSTDCLLTYLADELGAPQAEGQSRGVNDAVRRIETVLAKNAEAGRHAVVVLDEAHLLEDNRSLEAVRLLLNFETNSRPRLTVLLVGQPPLLAAVERMPQLEERLAMKCVLRPMSPADTAAYVNHRLAAAGAPRTVFEQEAITTLHERSRGLPRRINRLCELSLLVGYAEEQPSISRDQVEAVHDELAVAVAE